MGHQFPIFLTAEWRYLMMLNFEVDPCILRPYIPAGTELDHWEGKAFISMVGFLFQETRIFGLPIPFHRNFEEVNLRFYVRRKADNEWHRAVVFLKEIVPLKAIAWTARALYNENYVAMPMGHELTKQSDGACATKALRYWWGSQRENYLEAEFEGEPSLAESSSAEEFIAEHYWGYSRQKHGGTMMYRVEHPKWRIWNARKPRFQCNVKSLYGDEFVEPLSQAPASAFIADGSAVTVSRGMRLSSGIQ